MLWRLTQVRGNGIGGRQAGNGRRFVRPRLCVAAAAPLAESSITIANLLKKYNNVQKSKMSALCAQVTDFAMFN